jgi:HAD superfamily phosphatase (TIGR01668 family)
MLGSLLEPDWDVEEALPALPLTFLQERGLRALVLDVDRTLLPHRSTLLPASVDQWLRRAHGDFHLHLLSNNPSRRRVGAVAELLNLSYTTAAAKPRRAALRRVLQELGHPPDRVAMIGDRLFTDVLAGNRLGMFTVLVRPLAADGSACGDDLLQTAERRLAGWLGADLAP